MKNKGKTECQKIFNTRTRASTNGESITVFHVCYNFYVKPFEATDDMWPMYLFSCLCLSLLLFTVAIESQLVCKFHFQMDIPMQKFVHWIICQPDCMCMSVEKLKSVSLLLLFLFLLWPMFTHQKCVCMYIEFGSVHMRRIRIILVISSILWLIYL